VILEDAGNAPNFKRAPVAKEFGVSNLHFVPCAEGVLEYGRAPTTLEIKQEGFISAQARDIFTSAKAFSSSSPSGKGGKANVSKRASTRDAKEQTKAKLSEFSMAIGNGNEDFGLYRLKAWQVLYCGGTQAIVDSLQKFSNDFTVAFKKEKFDW
jgi:hypothetical protein